MIKTGFGVSITVLAFSVAVIAFMHVALSQYRTDISAPDYSVITSSIHE
ncbi:hypothetical protein [Ensifer adhaerens]|nr:hypothetical protein [Ensifer adhaerens]